MVKLILTRQSYCKAESEALENKIKILERVMNFEKVDKSVSIIKGKISLGVNYKRKLTEIDPNYNYAKSAAYVLLDLNDQISFKPTKTDTIIEILTGIFVYKLKEQFPKELENTTVTEIKIETQTNQYKQQNPYFICLKE